MTSIDKSILVTPRAGADLDNLARSDGPLMSYGTLATSLARRILEGNGKAEISTSDLKIILDTQSAVKALFDNFEFSDKKTLKPLIWVLLKG